MSVILKKIIFLFICLFLFKIVQAQQSKIDSSSMVTLRIDPVKAGGLLVSQIFDEVSFIPLETTKESLFGKIKQLEFAEDCFIIFDEDTKSILIFNQSGKFRAKINGSQIANPEDKKDIPTFYSFLLKSDNERTYIQIKTNKSSAYFDLDGKLIKKEVLNKEEIKIAFTFPESQETIKLNQLIKSKVDSSYYELAIYNKEHKFSTGFFPFQLSKILNDDLINSGKTFFYYGIPDELFYSRYYENNIYKITSKKASLAYQIILPEKYSLPANFMTNPIFKGRRMEYFQKNRDKVYGIFNTYLLGKNLFFNLSSFGSNKKTFVYKLKDNQLISMRDLEPDQLSSFLPVTDAGFLNEYENRGFNLYKDGYLYNSYSSLAMFTFKEQSSGKKPKYNAVLTEYFKTQNKKSNPVIIRLKPRKE